MSSVGEVGSFLVGITLFFVGAGWFWVAAGAGVLCGMGLRVA